MIYNTRGRSSRRYGANSVRFDALRLMRSIRDELDEQKGMTFAQQQTYIRKRLRDESANTCEHCDSELTGRTEKVSR